MSSTYRANRKQEADFGIWEGWDDFRFPAQAINNGGEAAPVYEETSGRLLFSANSIEFAAGIVQMPHTWHQGTEIRPHLHWSKTTSSEGLVLWGMQWRKAKRGEVISAWSEIDYATPSIWVDSDTANLHSIMEFSPIPMSGDLISTIVNFRFGRIATDVNSDTYAGNAALWEFDMHYKVDSRGSRQEYIK